MSQVKVPVLNLRRGAEPLSGSSMSSSSQAPRPIQPPRVNVAWVEPRKVVPRPSSAPANRFLRQVVPVRAKLKHPSDLLALLAEQVEPISQSDWTAREVL